MAEPPKPKAVNIRIIDSDQWPEPYRLLREVRAAHHDALDEAHIALAWHLGWTADADGHLRLGQAKKAADPWRHLSGVDVVILLNREIWSLGDFGDDGRRALLDHELSHITPDVDGDGVQTRDELGRPVWRVRKHDVEEFVPVVQRHGLWKSDLVALARAAAASADAPLLGGADPTKHAAGRSGG